VGEQTAISWTNKTWNPWQGCHKVSPGCAHCYMFAEKVRYGQDPATVVRSKPPTFNAPLKWTEPALVFTCSWSDFFIEEADAWRADAWEIIRATPHLTYQILTKRPERIAARLPADWGEGYPNVWLGVTDEGVEAGPSAWARRISILLGTPAAVRFLSIEPLLEVPDLRCAPWTSSNRGFVDALTGETEFEGVRGRPHAAAPVRPLDWVIVGGESGPRARPCHVDSMRLIVRWCREAGVPVFVKQLGALPVMGKDAWRAAHPTPLLSAALADLAPAGTVALALRDRKGGNPEEWPADLRVRQWPEVRVRHG
jgi:protein gp37